MRTLVIVAALLVLCGCDKDPISRQSTNNPSLAVDLMLEHDGVRVYRFEDGGHYVYFTVPAGVTMRPSYYRSTGKSGYMVPASECVTGYDSTGASR